MFIEDLHQAVRGEGTAGRDESGVESADYELNKTRK